jgi:cysteine desulfurase / selenocysteine lyase
MVDDIQSIEYCRSDFPILSEKMHGKPIAFLDSASSAQKPSVVIDKMADVMRYHYANVHRGLYRFSQMTTAEYESVRGKVADFIGATENEIVFTRNTTESINLVATSWGTSNLKAGDEVILTAMEHHANIVPWQMLSQRIGFIIKVVPVFDDGSLDIEAFKTLLSNKTRFVGIVHISNALGVINPVQQIVSIAKTYNKDICILVDASQSVVHTHVDVKSIGCDFLTFTGHKIYGPTGVGVLWGRYDLLDSMPPYQGGGDMIERVSFEGTTFKPAPMKFEAGTPAFIDVIGLGAAIDYVRTIDAYNIIAHENALLDYAQEQIKTIDGLKFYGTTKNKAPILSFTASWAHISDIAMVLDQCGVAVRSGHHCCMPLMQRFGIEGTIRASFGLYTNKPDIDALISGLKKAKDMLS